MTSILKGNNGSRLLQALLLLFVTLGFAACKDDTTPQKEKDDKQIQQYFQANGIDPATVTKTSSGLYYQLIEEGTGDKVFPGDKVSVHYVGTFLNGTKFDSSRDRNAPFNFTVGVRGVIAGWDEGLPYMRAGETARLYIPSHLGYGPYGSGSIPGNSPLLFEIEVLEILP
ncbi:FKBP-type peptidyl-prolyl cis-trans isomerase [uncultured Pontibacter sp.]|uniref:FKBP-type peptidyl-prolyl cis-trans isomerase n=1 Tax=uncultured Pontibacter sp. TaxID=453356 RepID=UPI00262605E4|nr:FKBP-type peptidyl-prolyl cis-trans isomerase [uncultured Pontibacter sp.]